MGKKDNAKRREYMKKLREQKNKQNKPQKSQTLPKQEPENQKLSSDDKKFRNYLAWKAAEQRDKEKREKYQKAVYEKLKELNEDKGDSDR